MLFEYEARFGHSRERKYFNIWVRKCTIFHSDPSKHVIEYIRETNLHSYNVSNFLGNRFPFCRWIKNFESWKEALGECWRLEFVLFSLNICCREYRLFRRNMLFCWPSFFPADNSCYCPAFKWPLPCPPTLFPLGMSFILL